jgi:hypothetical protein
MEAHLIIPRTDYASMEAQIAELTATVSDLRVRNKDLEDRVRRQHAAECDSGKNLKALIQKTRVDDSPEDDTDDEDGAKPDDVLAAAWISHFAQDPVSQPPPTTELWLEDEPGAQAAEELAMRAQLAKIQEEEFYNQMIKVGADWTSWR